MIHLLWIIPLILLGIIITVYARRGVQAAGAMVRRIPWGWVIFGLVVCMLLIWVGYKVFSSDDEKNTEIAQSNQATQQNQQNVPIQNPWSSRTIDIPREGVVVYLYPGWSDVPMGGAITITPIDSMGKKGVSLHDAPREINKFPYQPEGNFLIEADPKGSKRSVQIYNRW